MPNRINQTDPSSAILVETGGKPTFLTSIDDEVEAAVNSLGADIIFLLVDKWEADIAQARLLNKLSMEDLLLHYVKLKISLHHLKRKMDRDWFSNDNIVKTIEENVNKLRGKTKEARRNYYVAKQRFEGRHEDECSCRGCRCIGCFSI